MIKCIHCQNENKQSLFQHDGSLVGYAEYGWFFTCLKCKKNFTLTHNEATEREIIGFREQWKKERDEEIIDNNSPHRTL